MPATLEIVSILQDNLIYTDGSQEVVVYPGINVYRFSLFFL